MGSLVDPIPNSLNYHHKNCIADSKENYKLEIGSERVNEFHDTYRFVTASK